MSNDTSTHGVTVRSIVLGLIATAWFAWYASDLMLAKHQFAAATQVPTGVFLLLVMLVLFVNPVLRLIRVVRPFAVTELMVIFIMCSVSIGIASFGTMGQLVPLMGSLYNRHFNTEQKQWSLYLDPVLNEQFFLAEDGLQAAAIKHRDARLAWQDTEAVLGAARAQASSEGELADLNDRQRVLADDPLADRVQHAVLARQVALAEQIAERADARWSEFATSHSRDAVIAEFPDKIDGLDAERKAAHVAFMALKQKAFVKADGFRRGLKEVAKDEGEGYEPRAVPGILYVEGEGMDVYFARWRRTRVGVAAHEDLAQAVETLESGPTSDAQRLVAKAADRLEELAGEKHFRDIHARVLTEISSLEKERFQLETEIKDIAAERRLADPVAFDAIDKRKATATGELDTVNADLAGLAAERDRVAPQLRVLDGLVALSATIRSLATGLDDPGSADGLRESAMKLRYLDGSYQRFLAGDVDWREWGRPLLAWTVVILLTYMLFLALNVVLFRQWAHNEKLTYPLAELPTVLAGGEDEQEGRVPSVFRSGLFWCAFGLAAGIHAWNHVNHTGILGIHRPIQMYVLWGPFVQDTIFQGLTYLGRLDIIFTLIGLSFLIPSRISFSLWIFHLFLMFELLVLVWLGYGENIQSFPYGWSHQLNFRTAQGTGAMLVFAAVLLWRCRRYFASAWAPGVLDGLDPDERREIRTASALFWIISVVLIACLCGWMGANLWYTLFYFVILIAITVAMMRAVTEGGIPQFQCFGGPLHLLRNTVGLDHSWTAPALFAPLQIYYLILFFDLKTFLAPAIANAMKIRDNVRMKRAAFHGAVITALFIGFGVSLATHLIWCYENGADGVVHPWFYTIFPQTAFDSIKQIAETQPVDDVGAKWWLLSGGVLMAALIVARGRFFWVPHPLGLIMLTNPLIGSHWFSILLGWGFKSAIGKYGNRQSYLSMRNFFIGLMMGEILLIAVGWATMQYGY